MMNLFIATTLLLAAEPKIELDVPAVYMQGGSFEVTVTLTAPEDGSAMPAWLFAAEAFSVNGRPLSKRDNKHKITLPKGAHVEISYDLAPYLEESLNTSSPFKLGFAEGIATVESIEVDQMQRAAEGLDFMTLPLEELENYNVLLQTNQGNMLLEFWTDGAPDHVRNFLDLSYTGFYSGTVFHRVIPGFMIQGGDPTGTGSGNGPRRLKAEFNDHKHVRGVLSMARTADPNSASCQFFVMHDTSPHLDNQYSVFGTVIWGDEVIDKIVNTPTVGQNKPRDKQVIESATVVMAKPKGE